MATKTDIAENETFDEPEEEHVEVKKANPWVVLLITILVLAAGAGIAQMIIASKEEAKKVDLIEYVPTVDVSTPKLVDAQPLINVQGEVMASKQTRMISEVNGAITYINPKLQVGEIIAANEILVRVNDADYKTQITNAKSMLADAKLALAMEEARAVQALRDWKKLGRGTPSALVLREPQITSAKAKIEATKATLAKSVRDGKKTTIRAPYRCKIEKKHIEEGAFLSMGSPVADLFSVSKYEIRLPLSLDEVGLLPNEHGKNGIGETIKLSTTIAGKSYEWVGTIERFEGGIDSKTFSMMLIVSIAENKKLNLFNYPPKGMFLQAEIKGAKLKQVLKIPRLALRENNKIWLLNNDNKLEIRAITILRQERDYLFIKPDTLKETDRLITSPIATPVKGMQLELEPKKNEKELKT